MKGVVVLRPSMSKRLIAKGVKELLNSMGVLNKGIIFISLGTTNSFIVEELLGKIFEKERYMAGYIGNGKLSVLDKEYRLNPVILIDGKVSDENPDEVVKRMGKGDVFIKGANAIDPDGNIGVIVADKSGGTVGRYIGIVLSRGVKWISPVSIGKLIPDVIEASYFAKIEEIDLSMGLPLSIFPIVNAFPFTEIDALDILFEVDATLLAKGGLWEDEGSIVLGIEGEEKNVKKAFEFIESLKDETLPKPIKI
ncbi:MAG: hypothetical protein QMD25_04220 [Caldisericia bacterium]|jgi:hypothetical protein|nr:hypothetical protein [Caldisericia bacterium]